MRNRLYIVLASIAVSFMLLGPVCAAAEYHSAAPMQTAPAPSDAGHGGLDAACCPSMEDAALAAPAAQKAADAQSAAMAPPPAAHALSSAISVFVTRAGPPGVPPSTRLSYYARSARILS